MDTLKAFGGVKVYIITKKQIIAVILILAFLISLPLGIYGTITAAAEEKIGTVVIDAGHGGVDGGVVGRTGIKESDINLSVSKILKRELEKNNIKVVMTRENKDGLYGEAVGGFKKRDMEARRDIILKSKPDLVISIHANKWISPERRGIQVFYDDTLKGEKAATVMQEILNTHLNNDEIGRSLSPQKGDYYITKCTNYVSIIIECGFLSNADDERNLISIDYQKTLARYISSGAVSILKDSFD